MDLDQETVYQVGTAVGLILLLILGLAVISNTFTSEVIVEDEPTNGTLSGELTGLNDSDGTARLDSQIDGYFRGRLGVTQFDGQINATLSEISVSDGNLTAEIDEADGRITGPLAGTVSGRVTGTVDTQTGEFTGQFNGTVAGKTRRVSPSGGLALVGLLGAFLLVMPTAGYFIHTREFE